MRNMENRFEILKSENYHSYLPLDITAVLFSEPGAMGYPGHAMVIVDMAKDKLGNKAIMVAQSYMPAQDIHIVTNLNDKRISPWYVINKDTKAVSFPEYYFKINQIGRFK